MEKLENIKGKICLPKVYTKEVWERCRVKDHKKYIGKFAISWSQVESLNSKTGFNTGLKGEYEYMRKYFSGEKFSEAGWGIFGQEVEAYITIRDEDESKLSTEDLEIVQNAKKNFTDKEKKVLEQIKPLGVFQDEVIYYIEELDVVVIGYVDDRNRPRKGVIKTLRDYKSKSENSKKDLHSDKKYQLEIYGMAYKQRGLEVQNYEYCIIERLGGRECMQGGGRGVLSVGERIWYEPYEIAEGRFEQTHQMLVDSVLRISELYSVYLKYFS